MPTTSIKEILEEKRRYLSSNVHILETSDPRRYDQVVASVTLGSKLLLQPLRPDWDFAKKVVWNLQTGMLYELQEQEKTDPMDPRKKIRVVVEVPMPMDPMQGAEAKLTEMLSSEATLVLVKWVFSKTNTAALENWFLHWSQNKDIKLTWSLIVVFTWSLPYFSPETLRWCDTYKVPISLSEERQYILQETADGFYEATRKHLVAQSRRPGNGNGSHADAPIEREPVRMQVQNDMVAATAGLNLHDVMTAGRWSYSKFRDFRLEVFSEYKVKILSAYNIRYIPPQTKFTDVAGFSYFKNYLRQRILDPLVHPERYLAEGIQPPKGLIMYGPPGIGKTTIAYALGGESGISVVHISSSDFLSKYVGESEAKLRQIEELVESMAPVIVFWDECESALANRASKDPSLDSGVSQNTGSQLLEWLGKPGRQAFIVGATNYIERIDPAFLRRGRFDKSALLVYPDYQSRIELLRYYAQGKRLVPGFDFEPIARATTMWNCAELSALPSEAAVIKLEQGKKFIDREIFEEAMRKAFRVDQSARKKELQTYIDKYQKHAPNYEPFLLDEAKKSFQDGDSDVYGALMSGMGGDQPPSTGSATT